MRNSPWLHQSRSDSAQPIAWQRDPPSISKGEQDDMVDRISRPTESALYRQSLYWKLDSFMDRGRASWTKMNLFDDYQRCMWTPEGAVKNTCKIRPHEKVRLPNVTSRHLQTSQSVDSSTHGKAINVSSNNIGPHAGDNTSRHQTGCHPATFGLEGGRCQYGRRGDVGGYVGSYRHPPTALPMITDMRKSASI
ncbi:unnamed protein product [Lymnaea stagnalis]|uniref:Uncharacterized protein n=1 Tax=Lymnaea stagnalis TaxID=6523 RepID=A0AAV2I171_LYMST